MEQLALETSILLGTGAVSFGIFVFILIRKFFARLDAGLVKLDYLLFLIGPARFCTPKKKIEKLPGQGFTHGMWGYEKICALKNRSFFAAIAIAAIYLFLDYPVADVLFLLLFFSAFALLWPVLFVKRTILIRKREAEKEFSRIIDYLKMYVLAGMGLESAIRSISEKIAGVWGHEFKKLIRDLDLGHTLSESLNRMEERTKIEDLEKFVQALRQSEKLGASLSDTLAIQAENIRIRRKQKAEELAKTAGVKIAIPLVLFIFPSLLVLYLGPVFLRFISGF